MTMHKRHPQRCLHSHICKWNKDNCQDCIDTDCASHRYIYNPATERDTVLDEAILIVVKSAKEMEGRRLFCTVLELCQKLEELRQAGSP